MSFRVVRSKPYTPTELVEDNLRRAFPDAQATDQDARFERLLRQLKEQTNVPSPHMADHE